MNKSKDDNNYLLRFLFYSLLSFRFVDNRICKFDFGSKTKYLADQKEAWLFLNENMKSLTDYLQSLRQSAGYHSCFFFFGTNNLQTP